MDRFRVCYHMGISTNVDHMLYWQMLARMADMETPLKDLTMKYPSTAKIITVFRDEGYDLLLYATADSHYCLDRFMDRVSALLTKCPIDVDTHQGFLDDKCMAFLKGIFSGFQIPTDRTESDIENFQTIELSYDELKAVCSIATIL